MDNVNSQEEPTDYDQEEIEALWANEAERRDKEIEDGIVTTIPGEEVMKRLRSRYKR